MIARTTMGRHVGMLIGICLLAVLALLPAPARAAEDVGRIREKCEELARAVVSERAANLGEGKDSELLRTYKDFDYLLKASKTDRILEVHDQTTDEATRGQLERLYNFLMNQRIRYAVASSIDNENSYETSQSMAVAGSNLELTLRSYPILLAEEPNRSNRRIAYLASRDLEENANVFKLNILIDLDRASQDLTKQSYTDFLAADWEIVPDSLSALSQRVLDSTAAEYEALFNQIVPEALDGMAPGDLRQYDVPYLLSFPHLEKSFAQGKDVDLAKKWLKDLGIKLGSQKHLRLMIDAKSTKSPDPYTFPIDNGSDTRISVYRQKGLPEYWNLFFELGQAEFYYHIDSSLSFEDRRLGTPVIAMTYGHLFQNLLADPAWRAKYLESKDDPDAIARAIRFRQLLDLRRAAAFYLFQRKLNADPRTPASEYTELMQSALLWNHSASEESDYLQTEDFHRSGMYVLAAVQAAQLRHKLEKDFGEEWFASREAGQWLKSQWERGFQVQGPDLVASWGLGNVDPGALLH